MERGQRRTLAAGRWPDIPAGRGERRTHENASSPGNDIITNSSQATGTLPMVVNVQVQSTQPSNPPSPIASIPSEAAPYARSRRRVQPSKAGHLEIIAREGAANQRESNGREGPGQAIFLSRGAARAMQCLGRPGQAGGSAGRPVRTPLCNHGCLPPSAASIQTQSMNEPRLGGRASLASKVPEAVGAVAGDHGWMVIPPPNV